MSVSSFGDMVTEAERVLTRLAATRDLGAPGLAAAWPDFCRRASHAITAATGARDPRWYPVDILVMETARQVRAARSRGALSAGDPDPGLQRAGVLLGASGDILASARRDSVADPMLVDDNIHAAQGRVAALLAAGAHTAVRALASHTGDGVLPRDSARDLAGDAMRVEQLATRLFEATPTTRSRADDVSVAILGRRPLTIEDAIEQWSRHARATVRSATPSARDLQALAADLARVATHSRALVRAASGDKLIDDKQAERIDKSLAESAAGWLEIAERWTGFHTAQAPTPSKIAASHALGQALTALTRHGREWADPSVIAQRTDLPATLAAVRRAMDVARDVAERQSGLPRRLASSDQLFAPAAMLPPSVERLEARLRRALVPAGIADITDLADQVRRQAGTTRVASRLLDPQPVRPTPAPTWHTLATRPTGPGLLGR